MSPNSDGLLNLLSDVTDDFMLQKIAEADYESDVAAHLKALRSIRDKRQVPAPMNWHPREVLELIRWSEPEDPKWSPGETGRVGHIMRAFCCAALLRAAAENDNKDLRHGENQTLAQLLVSVDTLGAEFQEPAFRFLVWRMEHFEVHTSERPFFLLGMLLLYLKIRSGLETKDLDDIVQSLIQAERTARIATVLPKENDKWLLGITSFDLRHDAWRTIGKQLLDLSSSIADQKVRARVIDVGNRLKGPG